MDWAVLYLRLFTGASMLFHNIGKIQNYNEIISSYPSPLYINPPAVFVIVTVAEALLAVLIIMGLWVRLRRGSAPVRPKKMTNRTIICTPAISIFGEIL